MTHDEIIEMAQECRLIGMRPHLDGIYSEALVAFAKLIAEAEREACAEILDTNAMACNSPIMRSLLQSNAQAIRVRGQV